MAGNNTTANKSAPPKKAMNLAITDFFNRSKDPPVSGGFSQDLFFRDELEKRARSVRSMSSSQPSGIGGFYNNQQCLLESPPTKRRKLDTYTSNTDLHLSELDDDDRKVEQDDETAQSAPIQTAERQRRTSKQIGPFILDSDSETDCDSLVDPEEPGELMEHGDNAIDAGQDEQEGPTKPSAESHVSPERNSERERSSTSVTGGSSYTTRISTPLADETLVSESLTSETCKVPSLSREPTSFPEQDEFEGIEDFEEFAGDGEEYAERRWLEEQQLLEALDGADQEDASDGNTIGPAQAVTSGKVTMCLICNQSLEGTTDEEASAHVNSCIDGTPTPLPVNAIRPKENRSAPPAPPSGAQRFQRAKIARPAQEDPFTTSAAKSSVSGFSKIMSSNTEDRAWAKAAENEVKSRGKPAYQRTCPFYKIMPGFFICVDAFRYGKVEGQNAYFLSHFHSDHYIGLTSSWSHGPIYCSKVTGNLVRQQLKVDPRWVVDLKFEKKTPIPGTEGVSVTMIPANHCPGSSLFLFEKALGKGYNPKVNRILHCGDFRACPAHVKHPLLRPDTRDIITGKTKQQMIDTCYLDTTYLTPKYAFPCQEDVINACAEMCVSLSKEIPDSNDNWERAKIERAGAGMVKFLDKSHLDDTINAQPDKGETSSSSGRGRLLVIIGTYSIGKERVCLGIAKALKSKIYAPPSKQRICAALEDPELSALLTTNPREAQVHMQMLMEIRAETLLDYLQDYKPHFSRIVGFRPTGWNYRPPTSRFTENPSVNTVLHSEGWKSRFSMRDLVPQRGSSREASCFGVPYSEHSSFRELTMFCCALRIGRIVPTVNVGSKNMRDKMKVWIDKWEAEKKKSGLFQVEEGATRW